MVVPWLPRSNDFICVTLFPVWKLKGQKFGMGFLRVNIWSRDFWGVCWKPLAFVGVLFFAPIQSSLSLKNPSFLHLFILIFLLNSTMGYLIVDLALY